jgi:hypothetical protein
VTDDLVVERDVREFQGMPVAVESLGGGGDGPQVAEVADTAVPGLQQVVDGGDGAEPVLGDDGVRGEQAGLAVDEDQAGPRTLLADQVAVVVSRRHDQQPVHPPVDECPGQFPLPGRVLVQAADQHQHTTLAGHVLDGAGQGGREGVRRVFDEHPDGGRPAVSAAQAAGGQVGPVAQPLGRLADPGGQRRVDGGDSVDHTRHRFDGYTGQRGDLTHGGAAAARGRLTLSHRCLPKVRVTDSLWVACLPVS